MVTKRYRQVGERQFQVV